MRTFNKAMLLGDDVSRLGDRYAEAHGSSVTSRCKGEVEDDKVQATMTARMTQASAKSRNSRLEGEGSTTCPRRPTAEQILVGQTETGDGLVSAGLFLRCSDAVECVVHEVGSRPESGSMQAGLAGWWPAALSLADKVGINF